MDLAGFNQQVGGLAIASGAAAGQVIGNSSTSNAATLTFSSSGSSMFGGTIQDTLGSGNQQVALTVAAGMSSLTGSNTFTGATTLSGGTLQLAGPAALYSGAATGNLAVNGGVLDLDGNNLGVASFSGGGTVTTSTPGHHPHRGQRQCRWHVLGHDQ